MSELDWPAEQSLGGTTKAHLDFLLMGLEALLGEGSEVMLAAAEAVNVQTILSDRVTLWRLRNANPLRQSTGGRKKVDIDEIRALVLVISYLAREHHSQIRSCLANLEAAVNAERSPYREPEIGDYLDAFISYYRSRMIDAEQRRNDTLTELALTLLAELLFYGSRSGPRRLWNALISRPELDLPPEAEPATETADIEAKSLQNL